MSADPADEDTELSAQHDLHAPASDAPNTPADPPTDPDHESDSDNDEQEEEEEEEEEEPKLKYARLTGNLTSIYRNGDSASAFLAAGDKMVIGTHNGNIHVLSLPGLTPLRTYHAHQATVTSVSISPVPPPPTMIKSEQNGASRSLLSVLSPSAQGKSTPSEKRSGKQQQRQQQPSVPNTLNNQIYVATSSQDGHVCVSSLVDPNDVLLRNFARPVQAVALSPDYKIDRTYLSGGLAGQLIMTVGGKAGVSADANTNSAAAAASGWLGSIGLGGNSGKDTVLHAGEGSISLIKWSLTGKWVVWVNEEGIKIMRSHLRLGSEDSEDAWRRIAHAAKPNRKLWQDMAGVWKARAEWIDDRKLEADDDVVDDHSVNGAALSTNGTVRSTTSKKTKKPEKLVVGWGDTAWVLHIHEGGTAITGRHAGQKQVGSADIAHKMHFQDCIVSGISLYTPSVLAILAYRTRDDDDRPLPAEPTQSKEDAPKRGRHYKKTGLAPQLRLVHVANGEELDLDELSISRFETLSAQDYHLGALYIPPPLPEKAAKDYRGALETMWQVSGGQYAQRMFSSSGSVLSGSDSGRDDGRASIHSPTSVQNMPPPTRSPVECHPFVAEPGLKLFIQSPFDCVLAIKRGVSDHLEYLLGNEQYEKAWQLVDRHPGVVDPSAVDGQISRTESRGASPSRQHGSLAEFFADDQSVNSAAALETSAAELEKRRIGDLWLHQLVTAGSWMEAGKAAGRVLGRSSRWEHWVWTFAQADKFDEITPYIPSTSTRPPIPSRVYEMVLGYYIRTERQQLRKLMEQWDPELYNANSVMAAIENELDSGTVDQNSTEDGIQGRDWRILVDALAKLYLSTGRARDALRCYIQAQSSEAAMSLIKEEKLMDAVADDIPGLLLLKVSKGMLGAGDLGDLEEASSEAISLLEDEAHQGTISTNTVIRQLEQRGQKFQPFIYFYMRALWGPLSGNQAASRGRFDLRIPEGRALVEDHADLAVSIFAEYDRELFMAFLRASSLYSYDRASDICRQRHYIPELVYILSKMGQNKTALSLIIEELGDVSQAIAFAKETPDLWDDLLEYSMSKPRFIRGLLEEAGTAIDPIKLVRRIPEGVEIEGLKQGIQKLIREHEIQFSISEGVAHVFRGEVIAGMDTLRAGQKRGTLFEVVHHEVPPQEVDLTVRDGPRSVVEGKENLLAVPDEEVAPVKETKKRSKDDSPKAGHCVGCGEAFSDDEKETLLGFPCSHVYHLSCLLRANPDTNDDRRIRQILRQIGNDADVVEARKRRQGQSEETEENAADERDRVGDADAGTLDSGDDAVKSVGAKVAHAHVIKNVLEGGCRFCMERRGEAD